MVKFMKKIFLLFCLIFIMVFNCVNAAEVQKKWANPQHLKVYIQPGLERSGMMKRAFAEWSKLTKNKVVFYYVDSKAEADIDVVFVDRLATNFEQAIGLTDCKFLKHNNNMQHATVIIPAKTTKGIPLSRDDVYTSMLHEIGHAIGIVKHSTNPHNIMYPYIDAKREITKYDLAELYRIYNWKDPVTYY